MSADDPNSANPEKNQKMENPELDEFFHRLPSNFRWPKPSDESVAAAVESIQRMAGGVAGADLTGDEYANQGEACAGCSAALEPGARFCVQCGLPATSAGEAKARSPHAANGAVHHYHHHYHHFASATPSASPAEPEATAPRGRAPGTQGTAPGGRAEFLARQVAQNWAQACNTKHLDDLLELYASDATLIRSNVPPVRSLPAIREFLHSLLEAGLGELEMESLRIELMGDIAMDLGRCKMLVPVVMGKRREERGKYLLVMVRQAAGTWKILADCWSSDQAISSTPAAEPAKKMEPVPPRKPR